MPLNRKIFIGFSSSLLLFAGFLSIYQSSQDFNATLDVKERKFDDDVRQISLSFQDDDDDFDNILRWQRNETLFSSGNNDDALNRLFQLRYNEDTIPQNDEHLSNNTCAILLFGLPRRFREVTLPSLQKNVFPYNPNCDYYIHYFDVVEMEIGERHDSNRHGFVNATEILEIREAIMNVYHNNQDRKRRRRMSFSSSRPPIIKFQKTTNLEFNRLYDGFLYKLQTERWNNTTINNNKLKYWPIALPDFSNTTVQNIVKMWHSIQTAWDLMKKEEKVILNSSKTRSNTTTTPSYYQTVAMLRSDVLFATKLNFRSKPDELLMSQQQEQQQPFVVIPNFCNFPVNDRMIYGDARGVEIWASKRFEFLDENAQTIAKYAPGLGIHDEMYLNYTIFPYIRNELQIQIIPMNDLCFYRVRADYAVRFDDCGLALAKQQKSKEDRIGRHNHHVVEEILERTCIYNGTGVLKLECDPNAIYNK